MIVSVPKDSMQTRVVTFLYCKILKIFYYSNRNGVRLKDLPFLFTRLHKLWNDAQLTIAAVACCSWYITANTTVFCHSILESSLSCRCFFDILGWLKLGLWGSVFSLVSCCVFRIICEEVPQLKQFISTTVLDNCDPARWLVAVYLS